MYNYNTSNTSFLDFANQLKSMGVKHWDWVLYLKNENLVGIDPYEPNLDTAIKCDIYKECFENPLYFFREIVRFKTIEGYKRTPFNKATAAKIYLWMCGINNITMTSRYTSKEHISYMIIAYEFLFNTNKRIVVQEKRSDDMKSDMQMIDNIISYLPDYITLFRDYNKFNCTMITNSINCNVLHINKAIKNSRESFIIAAKNIKDDYVYINNITFSEFFSDYYNYMIPYTYDRSYVDINTAYYPDDKFLYSSWDKSIRWNDKYYDISNDELKQIIEENRFSYNVLIHYEPEELLSEEVIKDIKKLLSGVEDDYEYIRREMCIHPFED